MKIKKSKRNQWLKWIFKIILSSIAIFIVSHKVDFKEVFSLYGSIHLVYILVALMLFIASKIIASFRYREFIGFCGVSISYAENIKLYFVGMFYNLFLPGGIGGDGYKIYVLQKNSGPSWKKLTAATIIDRLNGLTALFSLLFILFYFQYFGYHGIVDVVVIFAGAIPMAFYLLGVKLFFRSFNKKNSKTLGLSLIVQGLQLVCALFILFSLAQFNLLNEYLLLFLVSSIVAVIPFTFGGVGARELVFVYMGNWLGIDTAQAVAFSLLFFIVTALSSLTGIFFEPKLQPLVNHAK